MIREYKIYDMERAKCISKEIQRKLENNLEKAESFLAEMQSNTQWTGKAKESFLAFMDLVIQYHRKLTTEKYMGDLSEALTEIIIEMENFENNEYYINLRNIQEG